MDNPLELCRLCFTKTLNGIDIFRKPRKKFSFCNQIEDLLCVQLIEKPEWPIIGCQKCIHFLGEVNKFREKIHSTQAALLNVTPDTMVLPPIDDALVINAPPAEEPPAPVIKRGRGRPPKVPKIEPKEEPPSEIESWTGGGDMDTTTSTTTPTRRTSRVPKEQELLLPEDVVSSSSFQDDHDLSSTDESLEEEVKDLKFTEAQVVRRQKKRAREAEEKDESYLSLEDKKRERKQRQLLDDTLLDYDTTGDMDLEIRREDRLKKMARIKKYSMEKQEQRWKAYKKTLEKKSKQFAHLNEQAKQLKMFECDYCKVDQGSFAELFVHMEREHEVERYRAYAVCCKYRLNIYTVYDHVIYHGNSEAFKCSECPKLCKSTINLKKHMVKHRPEEEAKHKCDKCGKGYHDKALYRKHLKKHRIYRFDCEECKGMFLTPEMLQNHIDFEHRNIPRHICDICGKGFKTQNGLASHQKSHTATKAVEQCTVCGLYFLDMVTHRRRAHLDDNSTQCTICGKKLNLSYVKKHMEMVHTKDKIFDCTICARQFTSRDKMRCHMDIHLGIRYNCHFCSETYGAASNRLKHMQRKHTVEYANYKVQKNLEKASKYGIANEDPNNPSMIQVTVAMTANDTILIEQVQPEMSLVG